MRRFTEIVIAGMIVAMIVAVLTSKYRSNDSDPLRTLHDKIMACINYPRACG
jgi:hypothetical protein